MKMWIGKHKVKLLGTLLGAIAGWFYYRFVGCASGSCLIASNPFIMVPYAALLGYLFVGIFDKKKESEIKTP